MIRRTTALVMVLVLLLTLQWPTSAQMRLTGTQMLMLEATPDGAGAIGTLVVDLAIGPRWHLTYAHDRAWLIGGRHQVHDVSVTRVLAQDRTATLGWRVKVPEDGEAEWAAYGIYAWRWGMK